MLTDTAAIQANGDSWRAQSSKMFKDVQRTANSGELCWAKLALGAQALN
jgi:hypothetical protein